MPGKLDDGEEDVLELVETRRSTREGVGGVKVADERGEEDDPDDDERWSSEGGVGEARAGKAKCRG